MNKLVLYFLLIISFNSFAMNLDPNILINSLVENNLVHKGKNTCDENDQIIQKMAKSCVQKICGVSKDIKSAYLSGKEFNDFDFSKAEMGFKKIRKKISRAFDNSLEKRKKSNSIISKKIKKSNVEMDSIEISNLFLSIVKSNLNVSYNVDTKKGKVYHDEILDKTKNYTEIVNLVKKWVGSQIWQNLLLRNQLNLPMDFDEYNRYMTRELVKVKKSIKDHKDKINADLVNSYKEFFHTFKADKSDTRLLAYEYREMLFKVEQLKNHTEKLTGDNLSSQINLCDNKSVVETQKCDEKLQHLLKKYLSEKFSKELDGFRKSLSYLEKNKDTIIDSCKSPYYLMEYNRQKSEKYSEQETASNISMALRKTFKFVGDNYSSHTMENLKEKFTFGIDKKIIFGRIGQGQLVNISADVLTSAAGFYGGDFYKDSQTGNDGVMINSIVAPSDYIQIMKYNCGGVSGELGLVDDQYNPGMKVLNISSYSCEHPVEGAQIISHEIGHVLSDLIRSDSSSEESKNKYTRLRKCISKRNALPNYKSLKFLRRAKEFSEDHFRSEEDMADYLKSVIYSEENKLGESKNFLSCALLKIENDQYTDIQLDYNKNDPHSPPFYRLLNTLVDRDIKLPSECNSVIDQYKHVYNPVKCE